MCVCVCEIMKVTTGLKSQDGRLLRGVTAVALFRAMLVKYAHEAVQTWM